VAAGNDRDRHVTLAPRTGRRPNCGPTATSHPRGWPASQGVGSAARADSDRGGSGCHRQRAIAERGLMGQPGQTDGAMPGPAIRQIVTDVLDKLDGRETCELVNEVAQPVVSRVIGSFMGIPPEDDIVWARLMNSMLGMGDPDLNPGGIEEVLAKDVSELFARCGRMIAERREHPTDDLTSVLVHAEIDGQKLEEHEIVMGFFLLVAAGNDSTKATYCSGMRALMENPAEKRKLLDDPSLIPSAVEEALRMFPACAHFARTPTRD